MTKNCLDVAAANMLNLHSVNFNMLKSQAEIKSRTNWQQQASAEQEDTPGGRKPVTNFISGPEKKIQKIQWITIYQL